jgi:hypothetical protein
VLASTPGVPRDWLGPVLDELTRAYNCRQGTADDFTVCDCSEGLDGFPVLQVWVTAVRAAHFSPGGGVLSLGMPTERRVLSRAGDRCVPCAASLGRLRVRRCAVPWEGPI